MKRNVLLILYLIYLSKLTGSNGQRSQFSILSFSPIMPDKYLVDLLCYPEPFPWHNVFLPQRHSPGRSFQQKNPSTPSMPRASFSSMLRILAWALVERTGAACSSFSKRGMSSTYTASPVACLKAEAWVMGRPMGSRLCWPGGTCREKRLSYCFWFLKSKLFFFLQIWLFNFDVYYL